MLIYEVSRIFAHRKTIKQFLQPMIQQGVGGLDVPLFWGQFFRATIFCVGLFLQFTDAFVGRFYQYLHIFAVYYVYFIKNLNSVLGTKFL